MQRLIGPFLEYRFTWILDTLRRSDYGRLETTGETYVNYMSGAIYPESLIRAHLEFLNRSILGNTHSVSNISCARYSKLSGKCADDARAAVLVFFRASSDEYTIVFTPNATGALKLVDEAYPFSGGSSYVLSCDFQFVKDSAPCLFALTGQSKISNTKNALSIIEYAAALAALAATSTISLSDCRANTMAVSFYEVFGFPTGVGVLVVKKLFLMQLKRPWFAGGNIDVVQVPGTIVTTTCEIPHVAAVKKDFRHCDIISLDFSFLVVAPVSFRADSHLNPVRCCCILAYCIHCDAMYVPTDDMLPDSFVEYSASTMNISLKLRTGCLCNPGGAAAILGIQDDMKRLYEGVTLKDFESVVGRELGVVHISLGLASNFQDAWNVVRFAGLLATEMARAALWERFILQRHTGLLRPKAPGNQPGQIWLEIPDRA
ncbi:hypothetical protein B0H17DRAFT_1160691 [Mycena rosella]|uniref:PLP-dependent transferase n=1 Tax=Mycena rosella TaxID=1033263 RepID=A0AAD7D8Z9_MYCRO|nr:hypothetical protein B0H17DRAFT_1160691 [Mycena rosella]